MMNKKEFFIALSLFLALISIMTVVVLTIPNTSYINQFVIIKTFGESKLYTLTNYEKEKVLVFKQKLILSRKAVEND